MGVFRSQIHATFPNHFHLPGNGLGREETIEIRRKSSLAVRVDIYGIIFAQQKVETELF